MTKAHPKDKANRKESSTPAQRREMRLQRLLKAESLRLADRAHRKALTAERREARAKPDRETRARVRRAIATLRRLAQHARRRLVRRQQEERKRLLAELRARFAKERRELAHRYRERLAAIRVLGLAAIERRRQKRAADADHRRSWREVERREKAALKAATASARERRQESAEDVEREIEAHHPEWMPLWRRLGSRIKARPGMSRAEAFFHYAHEHPSEAFGALDDGQEAWIAEQEARLYAEHGLKPPKAKRKAARVTKKSKPIPQSRVLAAVRKQVRDDMGMAFVPDVARSLLPEPLERIQEALLAAARARKVELRPESGVGRLTEAELRLCPRGHDGLVLSWARLLEDETAIDRTDTRVLAAARKLAGSSSGPVHFAALRKKLRGLDRETVDRALRRLHTAGRIVMAKNDDQAALTQADRDAALFVGGDAPRHVLYLRN